MSGHQPPRIVLSDVYELSGPRLTDARAHRRFGLDPEAARFFGWTVEAARAAPDSHYVDVVCRFLRGWETGSRLSLVIRRTDSPEPVGMVELRPRTDDEADISYLVAPKLRGQGLATLAVTALLNWAMRELGLRRAVIQCDIENIASARVATKCGFLLVGSFGRELRFVRELRKT